MVELERRVTALESTVRNEVALDGDHDIIRAVVVVDRTLDAVGRLLRERNMLVIFRSVEDIDMHTGSWLLPFRTLIVADEQPFTGDASSFSYGIVSVRLLSEREPARVTKLISDAFVMRRLWNKRHGFLLLLRDDGQHEYQPLVD